MPQQRAFVQKLRPRSNSKDLRRQIVSSSSFKSNEIPSSSSGISLSTCLPICDIVDPVDIEECVAQGKTRSYESSAYSNWTVRQFADFPSDDVELKIIEREILYKDPPYPCDISKEVLPAEINEILDAYSSNFVTINRKYEHFSTGEIYRCKVAENVSIVQNLSKQVFEIDLDDCYHDDISRKDSALSIQSGEFSRSLGTSRPSKECILDFNQSSADPIISGIIDRVSLSQMDTSNSQKREKNRQSQLFNVYPLQHEDDIIEKRQRPALPCEFRGHRLFFKINSLRLDLEIEPIFASVALYDAKEHKKVSENFYFDCNTDALKNMLKAHISYQDVSSLSRSAIFNVTHPSNDMFLVFKIEKVLQAGELSEAVDAYLREDKNKEKLKINCMEFCDRLGAYRMPFAWAAIDLSKIILGATNFVDTSTIDQKENLPNQCALEPSDSESVYSTDTFDRRSQNSVTMSSGTMKRSMIGGAGESTTFSRNTGIRRSLGSITSKATTTKVVDYGEIDKFKPLTLTVSNFFRQESDKLSDDDLYKYLNEIRKPASLAKKLKCIPGTLKFDISPFNDDLVENCISPELLRLIPFRETDFSITKDILEFPSKEIYAPHYGYRNLLYVYPKSVNFNSKPGSARNISVKVQLMQGASESLTAIFGKSSCPSKTDCYYTSVNYHNKAPQFHDEIKMQLPLDLNDTHHLLFTFYHISCKPKSALTTEIQSANLETPIGYAWLPLHPLNELPSGEYSLPVSLDPLPPCYFYLSPDTNFPNTKWLDNHKSVFNIVISPVTTLYTQDKYLDAFSHIYHILRGNESHSGTIKQEKITEHDLQKAIKDLTKARPEPLVKFLYIILDRLIDLIILPPLYKGATFNVEQTCFEMLGQIAKICTFLVDGFCDQHNRSSLLTTYIQYSKVGYYDSDVSPVQRSSCASSSSCNAAYQTENSDLLEIIRGFEKSSLLKSGPDSTAYSNFVHQTRKVLHEELVVQWLESKGAAREMAYCNAWFFFELMIKSMGEYLLVPKPNRIYLKRKLRFSQHFVQDLTSLVSHLTTEIICRYAKDQRFARNLNCSLAFFVRDTLSLMDRTFIFGLIRSYCKQILAKITTSLDSDYLFLLKLEFLRIVCSHEHYLSLNLPFASGSLPLAQFQTINQQPAPPPQQPPSPSPSLSSRSSNGSATVSSTNGSLGGGSGGGGRCLSSSAGGGSSTGGGLGAAELTVEYRSRHFLAGLVLADLTNALETKNRLIQNKAINILRNLLFAHDNDARLGDKFVKARIALMYFPILGIVMDSNGHLFDPYFQSSRDSVSYVSALEEDVNAEVPHVSGCSDVPTLIVNDICLPGIASKRSTLSSDDTRNLLLCFCWVLKNIDAVFLRSWLQELPFFRATQLLDVLQFCVSCFEYKPRNEDFDVDGRKRCRRRISLSELKSVILGTNAARLDILNRRQKGLTGDNAGTTGVRWRKDQTFKHNIIDSSPCVHEDSPVVRFELPNDPIAEGNLCTEINSIVLDILEMIVKNVTSSTGAISPAEHRLNSNAPGVINLVMRLILHMLECQQSVQLCQNLFATQRSLVCKFPDLLFEEDVDQCAHLCLLLLRHCAGRLQPIRAQAAASLYLLLRQSYESSGNFARAKMQITVSLSSLVGSTAGHPSSSSTLKRASLHDNLQYSEWFDESNLRRSLKRILSYAESDTLSVVENSGNLSPLNGTTSKNAESNIGVGFCEQVKDLVFNLHMILSDTVKMKEFQNDFEMLIDLMYRIAKGYQNSPDLRLTWLQNMAQKQFERGNFAEAAQCYVHSAALAAEYLSMLENEAHLPEGAISFLPLSDDVLEESAVGDDVIRPEDDEGVCVGAYFTENGLCFLLERAAAAYCRAQMFEAAHSAYKILLPILEYRKKFQKIAQIYSILSEYLIKIDNRTLTSDKRLFGTYFRVGFYGNRFGDLDGQEFVYREPSITKLPEISHRLESFYVEKLGGDQRLVEIIKDSNNVDRNALDPRKAYLQITYVEPYFDSWEIRRRTTHFDRNFNINRFVYCTPFTLDGRAHGDLKDQYKRKTVLTTVHSFPYVKTRVRVVQKDQKVLTPVEVAIEDVKKKTRELDAATHQEPRDAKMLQMVLQGCIGTTVNQGPLEVANVFLCGSGDDTAAAEKMRRNKLRLAFKDFSKKCADALRENKRLIGPDQKEYQKELERNYVRFTERLAPMLSKFYGAPATPASTQAAAAPLARAVDDDFHENSDGDEMASAV